MDIENLVDRFKTGHLGRTIDNRNLLSLAALHASVMIELFGEPLGESQWNPDLRVGGIKHMLLILALAPDGFVGNRCDS